jgi:glycosyltransferase involved in cell wall biosynthesis
LNLVNFILLDAHRFLSSSNLSLCLIVRDGELTLAKALESARPFFDEIVVVDTGSVDRTKQIAAEHGAKVFDFPWCDSFSAARNHSIEQATSDWIFWMDADDVLPQASGAELRQLIESCPERDAAFWVNVEEVRPAKAGQRSRVTSHGHVKLFPRRDDIRFRYRVHEQIAPVISELGLPIRRSKALVRHVTDRSDTAQEARRQRNLRLALLDHAEHPGDPFVLLSLGITHLYLPGRLPAANEYLRQSVAACPRGAQIQLNAYLYFGQALALLGRRVEEEKVYQEALAAFPDDAAILKRLAAFYEKHGRLKEAANAYHRLLTRGRGRASALQVRTNPAQLALRLGNIHLRLGHRDKAERLWRTFLDKNPKAQNIQQALAKSYLNPCTIIVKPT